MKKSYWIKTIFITFIALTTSYCSNKRKIFTEFERKYPQYHLDSLKVANIANFKTFRDYTLLSVDSNKLLFFACMIKDNSVLKKGEVLFNDYQEKINIGDTTYVFAYNESKRLLYSFKHSENRYSPAKDAIFIKGRYFYYYKYHYPMLNDYQKKIFEQYKDSIVNNYVNEIPSQSFVSSDDS
ncbi:hypothetical protein [Maribellus maritimus]|uniref:hypothetical protein n=1 Tax=Maribellus maritimus TaxID=2870838 RepID=UPI001EEB9C35|nr:hypothetical protein [Maribellus maritimus]MCG6189131.1 hypothetical protein [Maribellus maritimus]